MNGLIIGAGEIGASLYKILMFNHKVSMVDKHDTRSDGEFEILHICFPYSDEFVSEVKKYQAMYRPTYTVIHSTVKPGTSRELGAIHSPVIGIHPFLEKSLLAFTKFIGGENASQVADYFRRAGMKVYLFDKQETTEAMKILDTTFYGVCVEYAKNVKDVCDNLGIPFEAWTLWTENYNSGYASLGHAEFMRPNLVPIQKKIGGHCVMPNTNLLETKFTKLLKELNE